MNLLANIYERETRALRLCTYSSLGPLARDSPCLTHLTIVTKIMTKSFKQSLSFVYS